MFSLRILRRLSVINVRVATPRQRFHMDRLFTCVSKQMHHALIYQSLSFPSVKRFPPLWMETFFPVCVCVCVSQMS